MAITKQYPEQVAQLATLMLTPGFVLAWWNMKTSVGIARQACTMWRDLLVQYGEPKTAIELLTSIEFAHGTPLLRVIQGDVLSNEPSLHNRSF